ncbi:hypothetical protein TCAL_07756 [Tigriopus californicus]|uniref:THAP-type domain-containing protein n=1 Tax=Tigriopus californicus TaxID=6832 RepID=A0A553PTA3_TIGCA|nr:hypothetical protein TCAL_07756 [Tigriopus californicus]|eukprot:TCALIF_07756-PA protein Name:"Protein of unknown function" AED:0.27 eAED:0.29 QI:0/-1/0/1/-1/1/1/0/187
MNKAEKRRSVQRGLSCCVYNCNSKYLEARRLGISFFSFSVKNLEQRELWRKAVCQFHPLGEDWYPAKYSRICALHFVNQERSPTRTHPSYVPTIFSCDTTPASRKKYRPRIKKINIASVDIDDIEHESGDESFDPLELSLSAEVACQTESCEVGTDPLVGMMFCERICDHSAPSVGTQCNLPRLRVK